MATGQDEWADFLPKAAEPSPVVEPTARITVRPASGAYPAAPANDEFAVFNPKPLPEVVRRGTILPYTTYSDKSVKFEPLASGAIGSILGLGKDLYEGGKQAVTLPKRVATGETQIPATFDPAVNDPRAPGIIGEAANFATIFGPNINPMVRSGDRALAGVGRTAPDLSMATVPSFQEAKRVGGEQHNAVRELPVKYDPQAMPVMADRIEQELIRDGVLREDSEGLYKSLDRLRASKPPPGETIHLEPANLISIRKNIANKFEKPTEDRHGIGIALKHIDDFIENPPAAAVLAGPASEVGELYAKARANSAAGFRGELLAGIDRASGLRAASAGSGQNLGNTVRSQVTSAILNAKKMRGFNPEEIAMLEAVPEGSVGNNLKRFAGNVMGGGGGAYSGVVGATAAGTAHLLGGGPVLDAVAGVAVPAVGKYLKNSAGIDTAEALRAVEDATLRRSPLFLEQAATQDLVSGRPWRDALARAVMNRAVRPSEPPPRPLEYNPNFL